MDERVDKSGLCMGFWDEWLQPSRFWHSTCAAPALASWLYRYISMGYQLSTFHDIAELWLFVSRLDVILDDMSYFEMQDKM